MISVLFTQERSIYQTSLGLDCWGVDRDARTFWRRDVGAPRVVIAHPPCARWGAYWMGRPGGERKQRGDDGGCFASALLAVLRFGGVLEHPHGTAAFRRYELLPRLWRAGQDMQAPPSSRHWEPLGQLPGGWVCGVEQGHYGHAARKPTWLFYFCRRRNPPPSDLQWGPSAPPIREGDSPRRGMLERLSKRQREATPLPFALELARIARHAALMVRT